MERVTYKELRTFQGNVAFDRKHWWIEIKEAIAQIEGKKLSDRQLLRELQRYYSETQLDEIRQILQQAADMMGDNEPINFPPHP